MTPRSRTGWEKWPNFHRGAFRPPSGGGSLRRRPPAPSASRRFEPVKLLLAALCEWVSSSDVNARARAPRRLKVREVPASFSVSSGVWALYASAYWLALPERRERVLTFAECVCMKTKNRRNRELRQPNFRVRRRMKRWAVCRGWRKLSTRVTPSASSVSLSNRHRLAAQTCVKIASESD